MAAINHGGTFYRLDESSQSGDCGEANVMALHLASKQVTIVADAKVLEGFFPKNFNSPATDVWQTSHDPDKPILIKDTKAHNRHISHMPDAVDEDSVKDELIASMKRELELLRKDNKRLESELEEFKKMGKPEADR